jgi:phenylalanyl-tRNA synthetase alpha chain
MTDLQQLGQQAQTAIDEASNLAALDTVRVTYLGKKGRLTQVLKTLGQLDPSERPQLGQAVNELKQALYERIEGKQQRLQQALLAEQLSTETVDVTLPGRQATAKGSLHPVTQVRERINAFFQQMGFDMVEGPEIETDYYNFTALNIPEHHPARAMHDTFYFADGRLLRTHTSPVQIRQMEHRQPPIRLIAAGRVYRCDSDVTHTPMFHQVEGLYVDEGVSFANLRSTLQAFFNYFFEQTVPLRFRASYFPFTEPSAEVDIQCTHCQGKGCRICKFSGWLEVLGCGMVHPNVLQAVNIDSEKYTGWAFGLGIDRLAMLRYNIDDLRVLFTNDVRFLTQFS